MVRRRHEPDTPSPTDTQVDRLHQWVLSLPWVVERPGDDTATDVRYFAVECEPLDRRQVWLLTGLTDDGHTDGIAAVLPIEVAAGIVELGLGRTLALVTDQHVLVALTNEAASRRERIEFVVLSAYSSAMS